MKIRKVGGSHNTALFVVEGIENVTFRVDLINKNTVKDVTDELKANIAKVVDVNKFEQLNLKSLEGTDI